MTWPRLSSRTVMFVVLLIMVNTPLVHSTWVSWRLSTSGTQVVGTVTRARELPPKDHPGYWLTFRYGPGLDPEHVEWPAEVDKAHWDRAVATRRIPVTTLPGHPAAYRVPGQQHNWFGLVLTLVADLALVGLILLARRYGARRRLPALRIAAIEPVTRGPLEPVVEQVEGDLYLVRGEVLHADDDEVILDAGEREVIVILDGHANPVGYQQPAQVRGRVVG